MVVVMPLGYGDLNYVRTAESRRDPALAADHFKRFQQALLTEVMPQVEATYHVAHDRDHRAIAGLSMGGQESLTIGLTNPDKFAYVIGLSSAAQGLPTNPALANLNPKDANLRLLWISCGTEDSLSEPNRRLVRLVEVEGNDGRLCADAGGALVDRLAGQPHTFCAAAVPIQVIVDQLSMSSAAWPFSDGDGAANKAPIQTKNTGKNSSV